MWVFHLVNHTCSYCQADPCWTDDAQVCRPMGGDKRLVIGEPVDVEGQTGSNIPRHPGTDNAAGGRIGNVMGNLDPAQGGDVIDFFLEPQNCPIIVPELFTKIAGLLEPQKQPGGV